MDDQFHEQNFVIVRRN